MQTYEGKNLRIHYNSDLSGDFHVINKSTGEEVVLPSEDIVTLIKNVVVRNVTEQIENKLLELL